MEGTEVGHQEIRLGKSDVGESDAPAVVVPGDQTRVDPRPVDPSRKRGSATRRRTRAASDEVVRLTVPARPSHVRLARLVIAGLAGRNGFTYEQIEDLRIAVDELCFLLVGVNGRSGDITLTYTMGQDALEVEAVGSAMIEEFSPFSERILAAIVDSHAVEAVAGTARFRFLRHRGES